MPFNSTKEELKYKKYDVGVRLSCINVNIRDVGLSRDSGKMILINCSFEKYLTIGRSVLNYLHIQSRVLSRSYVKVGMN